MWRNVKSLGVGKCRDTPPIHIPLNELNSFFTQCSTNAHQTQVEEYTKELLQTPCDIPQHDRFKFKPVTQADVLKVIRRIHSNAVGSDDIPIRFIKDILFALLPTITFIFNTSLRQSIFPSQWKSALVRPLNKTSAPTTCQDFRPISILPALSKGLEKIVHCQITEYLIEKKVLNAFQSGFRPRHSTETALLRITDDILLAFDKRQGTILTLFDFSKAFNCVNHKLLFAKLRALGFSEGVISWLRSYLSGRRQCVRDGDRTSDWEFVTCGVPQGSILGPLLFVLYVNDIHTSLKYCTFHMYADDLQIYIHFDPQHVNDSVDKMNADITEIVEWARKHGLKLNPGKTQPIIICHPRLRTSFDLILYTV